MAEAGRAWASAPSWRTLPISAPSPSATAASCRDDDGVAGAFAKYCRHRGHELLPSGLSAQRPSIVCTYHSRTYSLDASLKTAKGFKGTAGFDDFLWNLVELPVTKWHGLAFVDGTGRAGSLAGALAELDELVAPYEPERLVIRGRHTYNAASN